MSLAQARGGPRELLLAGSLVQKPPDNVDSRVGGLVVRAYAQTRQCTCMQALHVGLPQGCRTAGKRSLIALLKTQRDGRATLFFLRGFYTLGHNRFAPRRVRRLSDAASLATLHKSAPYCSQPKKPRAPGRTG